MKKQCDSCQALMINGVYCHELGCPDSWKDYTRDCDNCGCEFNPEHKEQNFCNDCQYNF